MSIPETRDFRSEEWAREFIKKIKGNSMKELK